MIEASIRAKKTKRAKGGEWVKLMIRMNWDGQRVAFGSGLVIPAEDWDADAGWIRQMKGSSDKAKLLKNQRTHLKNQKEQREQQWQELKTVMPTFTAEQLKAYVAGEFDHVNGVQQSFTTWVKEHIKSFTEKPLPGRTRAGQKSTQGKYITALALLELFHKETKEPLEWQNMDHNFAAKLKAWRMSKPAHFLRSPKDITPVSHNTVSKWLKIIRGWITRAKSMGVHSFDFTSHPEWTLTEEDVVRWAITEEEQTQFLKFDIKDGKHPRTGVRRVRDLFCVQCCVGQRISDLQQVVDQFNEDPSRSHLMVKTQKTRDIVPVPVMQLVRDVAERNGGLLPDVGAHSKYNKLLKDAARLSGLFEGTVLKGGENVRKADLISSHVARRSFVTIAVAKGVPLKVIMAITGHKNESELNKYSNLNEAQVLAHFAGGGFGAG